MLAMIKPINRDQLSVTQMPRARMPSSSPRFCSDEIASAAVSPQLKKVAFRFFSNVKRNFPKVLLDIWDWIKYNVFFFFFDEKREKNIRIASELYSFQEYYCGIKPNDEGKEDVKNRYYKLSVEARSLIEKQLKKMISDIEYSQSYEEAIKGEKGGQNRKLIENKLGQVLENPFQALGKDKEARALLAACVDVRDDLTIGE